MPFVLIEIDRCLFFRLLKDLTIASMVGMSVFVYFSCN